MGRVLSFRWNCCCSLVLPTTWCVDDCWVRLCLAHLTFRGFVIGLTVPVAAGISVASNFFVLNLLSLLGMVGSTLFMRNTGIPFILNKRHNSTSCLALSNIQVKIPVVSISALNFGFGATLLTSLVMLVGSNALVYYVKVGKLRKCWSV